MCCSKDVYIKAYPQIKTEIASYPPGAHWPLQAALPLPPEGTALPVGCVSGDHTLRIFCVWCPSLPVCS